MPKWIEITVWQCYTSAYVLNDSRLNSRRTHCSTRQGSRKGGVSQKPDHLSSWVMEGPGANQLNAIQTKEE